MTVKSGDEKTRFTDVQIVRILQEADRGLEIEVMKEITAKKVMSVQARLYWLVMPSDEGLDKDEPASCFKLQDLV